MIFGLGFLTLSSIYLNDIQRQNSDLALLKSNLLQMQSQLSEMNSTLALTNSGCQQVEAQLSEMNSTFTMGFAKVNNMTKVPSPYSLQVIRQNIAWLANSSQIINLQLANPLQGVFDVEGYSTMTVLLRVENVSDVGPVEASQDVEITLGAVLWWTNMSEATQGLPAQGAGGFTEELNMNSHFDETVRVYHDYYQPPSGNRTYFLDWQILPISVSTIETKAPYVSMLFFANSTAPVDGWAIVDLYVYLRN